MEDHQASLYRTTLHKYQKFRRRLQRQIENGSFWQLTARKRLMLIKRMERFRKKLEGWQLVFKTSAASGALATAFFLGTPSVIAQVGPFEQVDSPNPFGSTITVGENPIADFADLDNDGDQDIFTMDGKGLVRYFKNLGDASFLEITGTDNPLNMVDIYSGNSLWNGLSFTDIDGDADTDVFFNDFDQIWYYENTWTNSVPQFVERTGGANPLNSIDTNLGLPPSFVDIEADGDLDLFVGQSFSALRFYENTGDASNPQFVERTGSDNPLEFVITPQSPVEFADFDVDGDLDAYFMTYEESIAQLKNTGDAQNPAFAPVLADNPFKFAAYPRSAPVLADVDGDGDLDLIQAKSQGGFGLYLNTGQVINFYSVEQQTGADSPFGSINVGLNVGVLAHVIGFGDIDGDNDLDAFLSDLTGPISFYQNTGDAENPAFLDSPIVHPMAGVDAGFNATVTLANLDGDPNIDLFTGSYDGTIRFFRNTGNLVQTTNIIENTGTDNLFNGQTLDTSHKPTFSDFDNDNDLDLFFGNQDGFVKYVENTGNVSSPGFLANTSNNPFKLIDVVDYASPAIVDIDGDADLDLLVGTGDGDVRYFVNTGNMVAIPDLQKVEGTGNPLDGFDVGSVSEPVFVDLDNDGDEDMVVYSSYEGKLRFFENTGNASTPLFIQSFSTDNPFNSFSFSTASPSFADLDNDGDLDVLIGEYYGTLMFLENTGNASTPQFVEQYGGNNPFDGVNPGYYAKTGFADLDNDGDRDAVIAQSYYTPSLQYFENTGDVSNPIFIERTGSDNPFDGINTGNRSAFDLVDLDGDGDIDALTGNNGSFPTLTNTGDVNNPAFELTGINPFAGIEVLYDSAPALVDIDNDADLDLFSGSSSGQFYFFERLGDQMIGEFIESTGSDNPFGSLPGLFSSSQTSITMADVDGDLDYDLVAGNFKNLRYYENTGDVNNPAFERIDAMFAGVEIKYNPTPHLVDFDNDGDLDVFAGNSIGTIKYIQNTGSPSAPAFLEKMGIANNLGALMLGSAQLQPWQILTTTGPRRSL